MYKDGKNWMYAGIGILTGLLGGRTVVANADTISSSTGETKVADGTSFLATNKTATIPDSESSSALAKTTESTSGSGSVATEESNTMSNTQSDSAKASTELSESESKSVSLSEKESTSKDLINKSKSTESESESKVTDSDAKVAAKKETAAVNKSKQVNQNTTYKSSDGTQLASGTSKVLKSNDNLSLDSILNVKGYALNSDKSTINVSDAINTDQSISGWMKWIESTFNIQFKNSQDLINFFNAYITSNGADVTVSYIYDKSTNQASITGKNKNVGSGGKFSTKDIVDKVVNSDGTSGNISDVTSNIDTAVNWGKQESIVLNLAILITPV